jgi:YfiH family protein
MELILPDWPAPPRVRAVSTTRLGGVSPAPYHALNLADHVGDDPAHVARNRALLRDRLALPAEPLWLAQVHGGEVADAGNTAPGCAADAAVARATGQVCAVMTADCLPVLLCTRGGEAVAAAHAGWRGLAAGVIEQAVLALDAHPEAILAWLGPAIGPDSFEVGGEVRDIFVAEDPDAAADFRARGPGKWLADLFGLARRRLARMGVTRIYGGGLCTYSDRARFYSFRRDGATGRMASLIWLAGAEAGS